jgi:hypothetical protein
MRRGSGRAAAVALAAVVAVAALAAGCSGGAARASPADQAYLAEIHDSVADINTVRSDTQLVRLGHVVCDDFRAKASYEQVADRLSIEAGSDSLPSADLGVVITSAADNYCPQYRDLVS